MRQSLAGAIPIVCLAVLPTGCLHVKSDPVKVEPIEININVRVKVDRELDNFFNDLDKQDKTLEPSHEE